MSRVSGRLLAVETIADGGLDGPLQEVGGGVVTIAAPWDALRQEYVQDLPVYGEFVGQYSQQASLWFFTVDSQWVGSYLYSMDELAGQGHWAQIGETPTFVPDDPPPVVLERYEKDAYGVVTVLDAEGLVKKERSRFTAGCARRRGRPTCRSSGRPRPWARGRAVCRC